LVDAAIAHFWVSGEGLYEMAADAEQLIARPRDLSDNATPSGNSMMVTVLLKPSDLAVAPRYAEVARQNLAAVQEFLVKAPLGFGQWLVVLDYALSRPFLIAIVGSPDDEATRALLGAATSGFRPYQVSAYGPAGVAAPGPCPCWPTGTGWTAGQRPTSAATLCAKDRRWRWKGCGRCWKQANVRMQPSFSRRPLMGIDYHHAHSCMGCDPCPPADLFADYLWGQADSSR
jgi:hypothetical protein